MKLSPLSLENRINASFSVSVIKEKEKRMSKRGILLSPLSLENRINAMLFSISNQGKRKKNQ